MEGLRHGVQQGVRVGSFGGKSGVRLHMRKIIRALLGLIACGVLAFATANLTDYVQESRQSIDLNEKLIDEAVVRKDTVAPISDTDSIPEQEIETDVVRLPSETAPIEVDFDVLAKTNEDIIGWLYSEDTPINLPVVQSADNSYYLRRMIDGTWNSSGTLFADCRNSGDFSDNNTVIYGHNMKNKKMFGTLPNYKKQAYFDEHPVMWLLTPSGDYKVELVAGYVTSASSDVYDFDPSEEEMFATVQQAMERSSFASDVQIAQGDHFLTLSTCSYEYDNARYVLIGRLIPLM